MTLADSAVVRAAERQVVVEEVHCVVIDAGAARAGVGDDVLRVRVAVAVDVESERLFLRVDQRNGLVERREAVHGQDRPEDLLGHDLGARVDVGQHGRLDVVLAPFGSSTINDGRALLFRVVDVA